ncbi:peptide deformylase [Pseudomonas sp. RTB3]|nr:peptide deformylase [Pseudomonas sp. RTB3]
MPELLRERRAPAAREDQGPRPGRSSPIELIAEGLLAVCVQHECDHLNGKLFVDYLSTLKRDRIKKKLEKQHQASNA